MLEITTILAAINVLKSTIVATHKLKNFISQSFVDELSSFLNKISEKEVDSAILALRESKLSVNWRREIEIAISHLRLAIGKTDDTLNKIEINLMVAVCYKVLGENELINLYKSKSISIFERWLDIDLLILKRTDDYMDSGLLSEFAKIIVNSSKRSNQFTSRFISKHVPGKELKGLFSSVDEKLVQVGLDPYSIKEACDYDWVPNPYTGVPSWAKGDKDERLIEEAKKTFRKLIDEYFNSF
jgi:hypothetical protein